jgi:hypothetical protein
VGVDEIIAIATVAGVLIALGALWVTLRGVRDQLWLHTFAEYTRRYGEIVRELPSEARRPGGKFVFEDLPPDEQGQVLNTARAYLNLCSEEFFLHARGRIDEETWAIWREGMERVLGAPWIRSTWTILKPEYLYSDFCAFVETCLMPASEHTERASKT